MNKTSIEWTDATWNPVPTHPGYSANARGEIRGPSGAILRPMRMPSGHLYVLTPEPRRPRKLFVKRIGSGLLKTLTRKNNSRC
jgi:hypothetical protein